MLEPEVGHLVHPRRPRVQDGSFLKFPPLVNSAGYPVPGKGQVVDPKSGEGQSQRFSGSRLCEKKYFGKVQLGRN